MTDHDRLFKELITTFFVEFLELFLPEVVLYLDRDSLVALDKEIFTDVTTGEKHEVDVLMKTRFKAEQTFFLIHLENQASAQSSFRRRMFSYFARLHDKYGYPVYPIALFSYDKPRRAEPSSYQVAFPNKKVLKFNYTVIQLNRLNWRDYLNWPNPVASALMAKMKIAPEDRVRVKLECLRMLVGLKLDEARTELISGFVGTYLQLEEAEKVEFRTELETILPEEREGVMEIVTDWTLEGREEGKKAEALSISLRQLRRKVGFLDQEIEQQIEGLSLERLEVLSEALLDFTSLTDLTNWLEEQRKKN